LVSALVSALALASVSASWEDLPELLELLELPESSVLLELPEWPNPPASLDQISDPLSQSAPSVKNARCYLPLYPHPNYMPGQERRQARSCAD